MVGLNPCSFNITVCVLGVYVMDEQEFISFCAEVMEYHLDADRLLDANQDFICYVFEYNPYDDLNTMAEVVEKLGCDGKYGLKWTLVGMAVNPDESPQSIKQAFRDFIISTMPTGEDDAN